MTFADLILWAIKRVEVVDVRDGTAASSEHVTTVAKSDLTAVLERDRVVVHDRVREHVHQKNLVSDCRHNMEPTRMESHSCRSFADGALPSDFELRVVLIAPNHDVVFGAGGNQSLAKASIQTSDFCVMERTMNVFALRRFDVSTVKSQSQLQQLIVAVNIEGYIFAHIEYNGGYGICLDYDTLRLIAIA